MAIVRHFEKRSIRYIEVIVDKDELIKVLSAQDPVLFAAIDPKDSKWEYALTFKIESEDGD